METNTQNFKCPLCGRLLVRDKWIKITGQWAEYEKERDENKKLHETKGLPLLLWTSTKLKGESAEEFCKKQGWKYKKITKGSLAFYTKVD